MGGGITMTPVADTFRESMSWLEDCQSAVLELTDRVWNDKEDLDEDELDALLDVSISCDMILSCIAELHTMRDEIAS